MTQLSLSSLNDTVELQGTLERVVFHNEENGYTVFRVRPEGKDEVDLVTVVGHMGSPQAGASLRIKGRWVNNARFGRQVQMDSFESLLPATAEGIKLYLASGLIKGIGKSIAARIVKAFGEDTLRIFDEEPQRLLEISGITQKKLVTIVECWTEHQGVRNLVQFLQPHDIGASFAVRIYKHYGPQALSIVQENPYRLAMDIRGIGFLTADALAAKLGFESEHPLRIQAGTLYTLMKQIDDGHVYYPRRALVEQTCSQLGIAEEFVEEAVDCLAREERVVLEELDDEIGVYLTRFHHYESKIAYYLRRILASPKSVRFPKADEVVEKVVSRLGITLAEEQLEAVRTSATSKVMVLTGGPGTGKTTILNAIIQVFAENKAKILLAAPTGRAAKRMSEAIGREARTIHRLLEYTPKDDGFARNEDNPLACGLLVVDEASMMDTMLAYHLLKAAPLGATIVFVGDVHQLPSVGPGNVLGDLIASGAMPVVELVEVFRQAAESEIVCNAHLINRGEPQRIVFPISISCGRTIPIARRTSSWIWSRTTSPAVSSLILSMKSRCFRPCTRAPWARRTSTCGFSRRSIPKGRPCSAESGSTGSVTRSCRSVTTMRKMCTTAISGGFPVWTYRKNALLSGMMTVMSGTIGKNSTK